MKRNLVESCGWLVAIGLACQPAHAGDRKSAGRVQEAKEEIVVARKVQAVSLRYEMVGASAARDKRTSIIGSTARGLPIYKET
jgi:hypothetical protein